jgi:signal transduction histidine kinase
MSAGSHSFPNLPHGPDVLGELLHSLSQPLTGLRCSLELSLEEVAEQQHESVAIALQQTEKVIGMIQLMREYLDAEQPGPAAFPVALAPALRNVIEELASIAAVRDVQLGFVGTCTATVPVPEARLRLALQYLIATLIEAQPAGGRVLLALTESPAGTVLRAQGESASREPKFGKLDFHALAQSATSRQTKRDPLRATSATTSTLRRVRLAIASRVLETAGASLVLGDGDGDHTGVDPTGFVLRIPRRVAPPV